MMSSDTQLAKTVATSSYCCMKDYVRMSGASNNETEMSPLHKLACAVAKESWSIRKFAACVKCGTSARVGVASMVMWTEAMVKMALLMASSAWIKCNAFSGFRNKTSTFAQKLASTSWHATPGLEHMCPCVAENSTPRKIQTLLPKSCCDPSVLG